MSFSGLENKVDINTSGDTSSAEKLLDSNMARDAFATFIPISVESDARSNIIFDFFDLMAAVAAHGRTNGLGGRKLSRLAGWWAFDYTDSGNGFDGGYRSWARCATLPPLASFSANDARTL